MALTGVFHAQQLRRDAPQIGLDWAGDAEDGSEATGSTAPAVPANPDPNMPLAVYRAPSVLPSEDLTSSEGPTLATSDNVPMPQPTRSVEWPKLPLHLKDDEKIRNTPFEIEPEELPMSSTTVTAGEEGNPSPLPWQLEFRWEGGQVHASRGPLGSPLVSFSRQPIDISRATAGSSSGFSKSTHASTVLELNSDVCLDDAVWLEREASWARKVRRGALVRLLIDHYLRSHTSQGTNRRNQEASHCQHSTNSPGSASCPTTTPVQPSITGASLRRLANGGGPGGGEDDPDDGDYDRFRHLGDPAPSQTLYFACPYYKWRPKMFKQCIRRLRHPSEVKTHLLEKHYLLKCPQCHCLVKTRLGLAKHYTGTGCGDNSTPPTTFGYISKPQLDDIQKRPPPRQSHENQWRSIFRTIFPNEPQPRDVFVDCRANNAMQHIAHHFHMCCRHVLDKHQAQQARDDPLFDRFDTVEAQREAVTDEFTSSLMLEVHGQEPPEWSSPFASHSDSQNYPPSTVAAHSSSFPSDTKQNQSLTHPVAPLTRDSLTQNHSESAGLYYNLEAKGSSRVSPIPFPPGWHLGSQPTLQPINLFDMDHAALDYQVMTSHVVEQRPLTMVPQLGQHFDAQLHHQTNEDFFAVGTQPVFQPGPHNSNNDDSIDQAMSIGPSTFSGLPCVPETHGLAPTAVAGSSSYATMPTNDADGNATRTTEATFPRRHMQRADMMGSKSPSPSDSSYLSYQGTETNAEVVPLSFHQYGSENMVYGEEAAVISFPFQFA